MARIYDRDWMPERFAALVGERFQPIPPHRVLPASRPQSGERGPILSAEREYQCALAASSALGDTPAIFAARRAVLESLDTDEVAPAPLKYFGRVA